MITLQTSVIPISDFRTMHTVHYDIITQERRMKGLYHVVISVVRSASISELKIQKKIVQKFECKGVIASWGWEVKLLRRGSFIGYMYVYLCACGHACKWLFNCICITWVLLVNICLQIPFSKVVYCSLSKEIYMSKLWKAHITLWIKLINYV